MSGNLHDDLSALYCLLQRKSASMASFCDTACFYIVDSDV
jgi:hypothetical protein